MKVHFSVNGKEHFVLCAAETPNEEKWHSVDRENLVEGLSIELPHDPSDYEKAGHHLTVENGVVEFSYWFLIDRGEASDRETDRFSLSTLLALTEGEKAGDL